MAQPQPTHRHLTNCENKISKSNKTRKLRHRLKFVFPGHLQEYQATKAKGTNQLEKKEGSKHTKIYRKYIGWVKLVQTFNPHGSLWSQMKKYKKSL